MFQQQAKQERYETTKALHSCKRAKGGSVSAHVLNMMGYIDHLERLGFPISQELATDLILSSLLDSCDRSVMNIYNMNNMEKSISELHAMLKTAKQNIKREPSSVLIIQKGKGIEKKGKCNSKAMKGSKPKPKTKAKPP